MANLDAQLSPDILNLPDLSLSDDGAGYLPAPQLEAALRVAVMMGKPLLLTGEPGTGKSSFARYVADKLELANPFTYVARYDARGQDVLYTYRSLDHFAAINQYKLTEAGKAPATRDFIQYEALGEAIRHSAEKGERSVVLIDEIDKAPREFPNDLLEQVGRLAFTVRETNEEFQANPSARPILIVTSNRERELPAAFLRRCVYHHIDFPDAQRLAQIVRRRLGGSYKLAAPSLEFLIGSFENIRNLCQHKQPATAELLAWLSLLNYYGERLKPDASSDSLAAVVPQDLLRLSFGLLAKHQNDLRELYNHYQIA